MAHIRFDLVFVEDLALYRASKLDKYKHCQACCCKDWREVRGMLRYYGRDSVKVFRVHWQPSYSWKHSKRKPTPKEIAEWEVWLERAQNAVE